MSAVNEGVVALLQNLGDQDFWGTLTLKFQHGQVVHITKEESIQPEPKNRGTYGGTMQRSYQATRGV